MELDPKELPCELEPSELDELPNELLDDELELDELLDDDEDEELDDELFELDELLDGMQHGQFGVVTVHVVNKNATCKIKPMA
jgi:hypothetical protein